MLGLFKQRTKTEVLQKKYESLMKKSFDLSTTRRAESDKVFAEAQEVLTSIEALEKNN